MSDTKTRLKETNDLGYYEIDATNFRPMSDWLLVKWEHHMDEIKLGKVSLVRPDTLTKQKYTGVVVALGPDCDPQIKIGDRLLFDQFSHFEKFFDAEHGRMALIKESAQGSAFAIIPARAKIGEGESDYNYEA